MRMKFDLSHILRVVKDSVLRTYRPKAGILTGGWRKLSDEDVCFLPDNMRVIKARRMKWKGHVAHMKGVRIACRHLGINLKGEASEEIRHKWECEIIS
jgi:hypothetical protein